MGDKRIQPIVVETQPVDQCVGLRQTEHAWLGVARLRFGRHGTDLYKSKPHGGQAVNAARVFIQPGCQPDPVRKLEPGQLDGVAYAGGAVSQRQRRVLRAGQRSQCQFVGGFRIQAK